MPLHETGSVRLSHDITDKRPPWDTKTPPLLFIHGLTCSSGQWFAQVNYFSRFYPVITYDLRGHGSSENGRDSYTIETHANDIVHLISGMHISKLNVVGSSIGGWIALELARKLPREVMSLVLVGASSHTVDDVPLLLAQINTLGSAEFLKSSMPKVMFSRRADTRIVDYVLSVALAINPELIREFFAESLFYQGEEAARKLHCPTLIMVGECDEIAPPKYSQELREQIPQSFLTVLPECGHFPHLELPKVFNLLVHRFVRQYGTHANGAGG
jgi:3-oxoadipate enol-lactonase